MSKSRFSSLRSHNRSLKQLRSFHRRHVAAITMYSLRSYYSISLCASIWMILRIGLRVLRNQNLSLKPLEMAAIQANHYAFPPLCNTISHYVNRFKMFLGLMSRSDALLSQLQLYRFVVWNNGYQTASI